MKKIAYLYIRVSTDEQADTGYSQRYQDETLHRYCQLQGITVKEVVYEDHSAKNFNRPQWNRILLSLRKHRNAADLVLFTKWDRFSRNAGDAYGMIATLNRLGVEPQAIEQPLDLSIPENKMMLAFYLAAPEVENDRRALNIIGGMRRARKEGRFMGKAPIGYRNKNEDGKKSIVIDPVQGPIMQWVFQELARGVHNASAVRKMAADRGLRTFPTKKYPGGQIIQKTPFWNAIRNPAYIGKIVIPAYKDEEEQWVKANHDPLISEALFYRVQDVLDGKKRSRYQKDKADERFPLRGFLLCHQCGRLLTASASKGRSGYHSYYHCHSGCKVRFKATQVERHLHQELSRWKPDSLFTTLYDSFLQDWHSKADGQRQRRLKEVRHELEQLSEYKARIRKKRINDELDMEDYVAEKQECERKGALLEQELSGLTVGNDLRPRIRKAIDLLSNMDVMYQNSPLPWRHEFLGSMFPEKLTYSESGFRTARLNEAAGLIFSLVAAFSEKEKGQGGEICDLSQYVDLLGQFSNRVLIGIHQLSNLYDQAMAA